MARRIRSSAAPVVSAVELPSRRLVVLREDDSIWSSGRWEGGAIAGAIVCVYPPAAAHDALVATAKASIESAGASVRMMPRAVGNAVVAAAKGNGVDAGAVDQRSVREIAEELIAVCSIADCDREELRRVVDNALNAEGV